jgi:hypothetical protein
MAEQIYVPLLDEGVDVLRPAPAWKIADHTYIILRPSDYDPDDEKWQFPPGSTVVVEPRKTSTGNVLVATRSTQPDRQTA